MDGPTAAATLGVRPGATKEEIRRAFRARVKLVHPDVAGEGGGRAFIALRAAFDRLMAQAGNGRPGPPAGPWSGAPIVSRPISPRPTTVDLVDRPRRRPRAVPDRALAGVGRDARGLSFDDHLARALRD